MNNGAKGDQKIKKFVLETVVVTRACVTVEGVHYCNLQPCGVGFKSMSITETVVVLVWYAINMACSFRNSIF